MALIINKDNFEAEVLNSDKPVLLDFFATWCGPCQMLLPTIEELSKEVENVKICKINTDDDPELAERYNVMSIPTLVVVKDGKVAASCVGVKSKAEILEMLK